MSDLATGDLRPATLQELHSRRIGTTDLVVPPIALDGSVFGWAAGAEVTSAILDQFRELGGTMVSTADHYAAGRSEVMIGSWLRGIRDRDSVVVATKIGRHPDAYGLSQRTILRAVDACLCRLDTDHIDLLSFDGEHPENPLDESLEAADRLIREGKVRFLAAAGNSAERIATVHSMAEQSAYPDFGAFFVEYNLMDRDLYEKKLAPAAHRLGRGALARLPLANGYLTGRFRSRDEVPSSVMYGGAVRHIGRRGTRVLAALELVARDLGSTSSLVALAWVLSKPGIAAAVVRAKDPETLSELFAAQSVGLTRHHVTALERASVN